MCLIPGSGRSPGGGNGNPLQCSCLGNPMVRGIWQATVHGVAKSQTRLITHTHGACEVLWDDSGCLWWPYTPEGQHSFDHTENECSHLYHDSPSFCSFLIYVTKIKFVSFPPPQAFEASFIFYRWQKKRINWIRWHHAVRDAWISQFLHYFLGIWNLWQSLKPRSNVCLYVRCQIAYCAFN